MSSNIKTLHIRIVSYCTASSLYFSVYVPRNLEIALRILRILRLHCAFSETWDCVPISRLRTIVARSWDCRRRLSRLSSILIATQSQQTLTFRQTGKVEIRRLRMQITRSRDCSRVLCNLEIGTQSQDSENAPCNLEIAQILRLRGTYICMGLKPRNHANTYMQLYGLLVRMLLNVFHNPCTLHIEEETREW